HAYLLLDDINQLAEQYGTADSITEVLASRIQVKLLEGKTTEAFSLIANTELSLAQTQSPRIRYFSHVLIASVYRNRNQLELALSHLLAATEAVMQTDDSRTTIRRLHVMLQIADIQSLLQNHDAALSRVNEVLSISASNNLNDIFYHDAMLQKALI